MSSPRVLECRTCGTFYLNQATFEEHLRAEHPDQVQCSTPAPAATPTPSEPHTPKVEDPVQPQQYHHPQQQFGPSQQHYPQQQMYSYEQQQQQYQQQQYRYQQHTQQPQAEPVQQPLSLPYPVQQYHQHQTHYFPAGPASHHNRSAGGLMPPLPQHPHPIQEVIKKDKTNVTEPSTDPLQQPPPVKPLPPPSQAVLPIKQQTRRSAVAKQKSSTKANKLPLPADIKQELDDGEPDMGMRKEAIDIYKSATDEAMGEVPEPLKGVGGGKGSPKYLCPVCHKGFPKGNNARRHIASVHFSVRPHVCHICMKTFTSVGHIKRHMKNIHKQAYENPKALARRHPPELQALRVKEAISEEVLAEIPDADKVYIDDEARYGCPICRKLFNSSSNAKYHIQSVHYNVRPYRCCICQKMFPRMQQLQCHMKAVHEKAAQREERDKELPKEQPEPVKAGPEHGGAKYLCPLCEKPFDKVDNTKRHIASVHYKVRPFGCPVCEKRFSARQQQKNHLKIMHGIEPDEVADDSPSVRRETKKEDEESSEDSNEDEESQDEGDDRPLVGHQMDEEEEFIMPQDVLECTMDG